MHRRSCAPRRRRRGSGASVWASSAIAAIAAGVWRVLSQSRRAACRRSDQTAAAPLLPCNSACRCRHRLRAGTDTAPADAAPHRPRRPDGYRPQRRHRRRKARCAADANATARQRPDERRDRQAFAQTAPLPAHPRPPRAARGASPAGATRATPQAAQRLDVAKAKVANNLNDQALADLRQIVLDFPGSRAAAEAAFMAGEILRKDRPRRRRDGGLCGIREPLRQRSARRDAKLRRSALLGRQRQPKAQAIRCSC